ncbi:MAG: glycosyltransferase family 2 protein [Prevotella sp.]|nr:glycosyltransferase family 2 protein [Prevotella sp.]
MDQIRTKQTIAILMATYNGERYVKEQLESFVKQTNSDWHLYIHDDGSTDHTLDIIRTFAQQDSRVTILEYESQKGAKDNFLSLLKRVEASYYMFADQDDVWNEEKIETSLNEMEKLESLYPTKPLIVYTDLFVADASLHVVGESFWRMSNIHPSLLTHFQDLAATTPITGSTMLFNQKAKESVVFPSVNATMHDAWITACVLRRGGIIQAIPKPLVFYRQHEANVVGATEIKDFTLKYRLRHFKQMKAKNMRHYEMLKSLGYGSFIKYLYYKVKYKIRARHLINKTN